MRFSTWWFQPDCGKVAPARLAVAFRRFVCLAWLVKPEILSDRSLNQMAPELGVTRAALSKQVRRYGDQLGLRNPAMKMESSRPVYAAAQLRNHWRKRPSAKPGAGTQ